MAGEQQNQMQQEEDLSSAKRRNRVHLTPSQHTHLAFHLEAQPFPSKERRLQLATELGIEPRTVQIWFQNQRQKARKGVRKERERQNQQQMAVMTQQAQMMVYMAAQQQQQFGVAGRAASPRLSYGGPDRSPELNALVDAAVSELADISRSALLSAKSDMSLEGSPILSMTSEGSSPRQSLRAHLPSFMLRSPKFRHRASTTVSAGIIGGVNDGKSVGVSPKLKTLQPRSQPNTGGESMQ